MFDVFSLDIDRGYIYIKQIENRNFLYVFLNSSLGESLINMYNNIV